ELGRSSRWGAFLDSTMDRFGDASIYSALAVYALSIPGELGAWTFGLALGLVPLALIVSYARARAEAVGFTASVGIAERADRLIVTLLAALLVGLGLPAWVLTVGLGYAAVASFITILQRMYAVYRQDREAVSDCGGASSEERPPGRDEEEETRGV
nr:CDP-alcohol phosphatidyltransferase family protein [Actinomycetales bacterium]